PRFFIISQFAACTSPLTSLLYGTTAQRPVSSIVPVEYYDTTLGLPVWWNITTSTWKRADGVDV
ncbi:hypothetical protein MRT11_12150, partial [Escherichia coli]|uniref:hypothetical protein n=1 Tax=Escherichia coli TaxID=562 RepID=UPI001FA72310